jgi:LacI family transcriptional regulator
MNAAKNTVTIRDIAQAAGVSVSTVSRVLNDKDDVAPETYRKVRTLIDELGYTSSLAARSLRGRRTNVIGLVASDVANDFCLQVIKGVNQATAALGYDLLVYFGGEYPRGLGADREQRFLGLFGGGIADGVIVVTPTTADFAADSPAVVVDPTTEAHDCPAVIAANRAGTLAAMAYLINLGHRRIGFITGRFNLQSAADRLQGYKDGLAQADIPLDPELIQTGDFSRQKGYACAQRLLDLADPPTAIFASNDWSAIGAIKAVHEAGLHIPDDVSVVGFDNIPDAAYIHPSLTTVDQSINEMGYIAAERLIDLIEGNPVASDLYTVPTELIVRDSCRAVTGRASLPLSEYTREPTSEIDRPTTDD